jgi:putative ABC transport system substrate-binding protein
MRRREFITLLGGAAAGWPLAARAQQPAMPVIGFLSAVSPGEAMRSRLAAFSQALTEAGYVDGRNVTIEYRWAEGRFDRLPELAVDLVRRQVSVIAVPGTEPGARAAKAATTTIPIVFGVAEDPVTLGLVANLARPGGNATGVNFLTGELGAKRVGLLRDLLPGAARLGVLVNPGDAGRAESVTREVQAAARSMGQRVYLLKAGTSSSGWQRITSCRQSTSYAASSLAAGWSPTGLIPSMCTGARPATSIASLRARSPPICRCKHRPGTSWSSISRPPRRLASMCRQPCSRSLTR